jgi:hypothetical protein
MLKKGPATAATEVNALDRSREICFSRYRAVVFAYHVIQAFKAPVLVGLKM